MFNKMKAYLEKLGLLGFVIIAFLSPCCFPLFAATAFGFSSIHLQNSWFVLTLLCMFILLSIGLYTSFKKHHNIYPILLSIPSFILILYTHLLYSGHNKLLLQIISILGMLTSSLINFFDNKKKFNFFISTINCPYCFHEKDEKMPMDTCTFFYECEKCKVILKPNVGDCCVFCSFGNKKCPPKQNGFNCCK